MKKSPIPITISYNRAKDFQIRNDEDILRELADRVKKHFSNRDKFVVHDIVRTVDLQNSNTETLNVIEYKLSPGSIIGAFSNLLDLMNKDNKVMKVESTKRKIRSLPFFK